MAGRHTALTEVTLAIARVAAANNPGFAAALGTELRQTMKRISFREKAFEETLSWLERFERQLAPHEEVAVQPSPGHAGDPDAPKAAPDGP